MKLAGDILNRFYKFFVLSNYLDYFSLDSRISRAINTFSFSSKHKKKRIVRFLKKNTIYISLDTVMGKDIVLPHPHNIQIGMGVIIRDHVTIYHNVTLGQNHGSYPLIEENVIIYPGACVFGGITVGHHSTIGAGAVVFKDVPPYSVVAGNPGKIIGVNNE